MVTFTFQIGKKEPSTSLPALWGTCVVKKFSHLLKVASQKQSMVVNSLWPQTQHRNQVKTKF